MVPAHRPDRNRGPRARGRRGGLRAGRRGPPLREDEADAIRLANATEYGLAGSIWTRDVGRALRVSSAVRAGNLSVNSHSSVRYWTPFGGFKQSGIGRELGPDALAAFTETKNVFISTEGPAQ
ncbi:aldehyde dehydrogenase family protein [Streptomyces sp. GLT-R25]